MWLQPPTFMLGKRCCSANAWSIHKSGVCHPPLIVPFSWTSSVCRLKWGTAIHGWQSVMKAGMGCPRGWHPSRGNVCSHKGTVFTRGEKMVAVSLYEMVKLTAERCAGNPKERCPGRDVRCVCYSISTNFLNVWVWNNPDVTLLKIFYLVQLGCRSKTKNVQIKPCDLKWKTMFESL